MTELQRHAIENPKMRASGAPRRIWRDNWSIILTVNK
jgi:hypothetical protein